MIEDFTEYHRKYYHVRRARLITYLGGKCVACGSEDDLQFDHKDRETKAFDIKDNLSLSNEVVRLELDKCQLLCRPCHQDKTSAEQSGFRHGTRYGWLKKHCKCSECIATKEAFYAKRNAARRKPRRSSPTVEATDSSPV